MTAAISTEGLPELIASRLGIEVHEEDGGEWPLLLSRHSFVASLAGSERIQGFGCARTTGDARRLAIMECLERYAQFGPEAPRAHLGTGAMLGAAALSPDALGLYSDNQYEAGLPLERYSPAAALEWVELTDVAGHPRYLPVEFVYPRARMDRKSLVAETSSGTAAHYSRTAALLGAVCELIERDSVLMFWHRQPPTNMLSVDPTVSPDVAGDLEAIRTMGFVVVVCLLEYDLGVPCVLALALRGERFAYGAGCHPCVNSALEHAFGELGRLLRWQLHQSRGVRRWVSLPDVRSPADHYALYDGGPYHDLLRQALENTIRPARDPGYAVGLQTMPEDDALGSVLACLEACGYPLYECDLTPSEMRSCGVSVVRAFAPGLIPMYFGPDRIRLGCRRLWGRGYPGRLCTLLPHFMT